MKQETLEEVAERLYPAILEDDGWDKNKQYRDEWIEGVKWQIERSYSDMQEYATFCIECDRKEMPLLLVEDWYKLYK